MMKKRVFVSGGAGVIGLELVPKLVAAGATVFVGDLKPRPESFADSVTYVQGDLNTFSQAQFNSFAPDVFIHLAATFERSTETVGFWGENFQHNVLLSHHLMTLGKYCPSLRRVVFASSYLIYQPDLYQFEAAQDTPVSLHEQHPIAPRNLTGMAKLAHELELQYLAGFDEYPFTSVCVRIFRGYGRSSRDVVSRWVRALIAGEPIVIYRPEGLFDYIYAADSAEGLLRLAQNDRATGVVNLGTGRSRRVSDIVDILRCHFRDATLRTEISDIPFEASQADTSKLRSLLNWVPEYDLEDAIREIVDFERAAVKAKHATACPNFGNVLITSAARKVPLVRAMMSAARRINSDVQVIAGDIDPDAPTQHVADEFWQMSRADPNQLADVLAGCSERGIRAVLPTRDAELMFWAKHREFFADKGISIIVAPPDAVARCLDKLAFAAFGRANSLPVIPAATSLDGLEGERFVVKERFGAGARGIGLDLEREAALTHAEYLDKPLFQPFVSGVEISIDAWVDENAEPAGLVLRRRDRVVAGESQITTTFKDETLEEQAHMVLRALDLYGPVVMQAIITDEEKLAVIEVNARFGGASTASLAVGLDSLYWSLIRAFDPVAGPVNFLRSRSEVRQVRLPQDVLMHDPDI